MNEFDLPCSDRGSTLVEHHVPVHELSGRSAVTDDGPVPDFPTFDARSDPEASIATLTDLETNTDTETEH
jgi:hypothetical protein